MRSTSVLLLVLAACQSRPDGLVICHNANCAEPADPEHDDTIDALNESLALEDHGEPVIDGIELDTFYRRADGECLYAHDLDIDHVPATDPANELAAYFARDSAIGHADKPFRIVIELKSHVSSDTTDLHTPDELALHATCAWQVYQIIADAAVANRRDVEVMFEAFRPALLQAMIDQTPPTPVPVLYAAVQGVPAPLDDQTRSLDEYRGLPIDVVELHAQWILDAQYEAVRSLGADLAVFMFSATEETFAVIEHYEPKLIVTSEARLMRRWLDY